MHQISEHEAARVACLVLAAVVASCAGWRPGAPAVAPTDPCTVAAAAPAAGAVSPPARDDVERAIVVGLPGPVTPAGAPVPRTAAERLVFAHLYDTLVRITCDGRVEPSLAAAWHAEDDGRRWTFTLDPDARDWDGEPVTADDVASSWLAAQAALAGDAVAAPMPAIRSLTVRDARRLRVELAEPVTAGFFADPALAVRTSEPGSGWPTGTGPYRPASPDAAAAARGRALALEPLTGGAHLEFRVVGPDARNALDTGVDLLVTTDPAAIEYAGALPAYATAPLAWSRAYLLAVGAGAAADTPTRPLLREPPEHALAALARDAVRIRARPATELARGLAACAPEPADPRIPGDAAPAQPPTRETRIVYSTADPAARALAERLVALAQDPRRPDGGWLEAAAPALAAAGGSVRAAGLPARPYATALRRGGEAAYVLAVDLSGGEAPCELRNRLLRRAPWLGGGQDAGTAALVPLVETRGTVVIRRGIDGLVLDGSGGFRVGGVR